MKHSSRRLFAAVVLLLALALCGFAQEAQQANTSGQQAGAEQDVVIKNGTLLTITHGKIEGGSVLIHNGKIAAYGKTVNVAATLPSTGLAITPAVFRSLQPETRTLFKKHTPPISYIDAADHRPD